MKKFLTIETTEDERKRIDKESKLLLEYEMVIQEELYLECFPVDKAFWNTIERCIEEGKSIKEYYKQINKYKRNWIV